MDDTDAEFGPLEIIPGGAPMTGDSIPIFRDLVDHGIIRVLDALFVRKTKTGRSPALTSPM